MTNTINWYINKQRGYIYIRYYINGKTKDEKLSNLDYYLEPETVKQVKINKRSESLAQQLVEKNATNYSKQTMD